MITPDYYEKFYCIGSECKNNCCCGGWDIEIDDESMQRFDKLGGVFGERVREVIDENNVFIRKNGRCPLLTENGLCDMVLNGTDLCTVCDEYPRFTEYYGDYAERGISISCEAAAKIILDNDQKVGFVGKTGTCDEDIFTLLMNVRRKIFDILQDRSIDVCKRIRLVVDYGVFLQDRINNNNYSEFEYTPVDRLHKRIKNEPVFDFMLTLECLNDDWYDILDKHTEFSVINETKIEQLAVYFVYRYLMKAVYDCDALSKLKFMAVSIIAIVSLARVCGSIYESARRYSIEIEHSEDNVELFYDEFLFNDELNLENIIGMIDA